MILAVEHQLSPSSCRHTFHSVCNFCWVSCLLISFLCWLLVTSAPSPSVRGIPLSPQLPYTPCSV
ncbi:hypothetical protein JB92DRAFT_2796688 [Gautieria morchelliformis]|nr:hypothetical protein JB92DRAFT_2796688 [Gautieria morchelliformis]